MAQEPYCLVIDDDPAMLELVVVVLREAGYSVVGLGPIDGLKKALLDPPAVLLLDMMMPELDGAALHNEMVKHAQTAHVPFIVITAWHNPATWFAGLGPDAILEKPFGIDELLATVGRIVPLPPRPVPMP